MQGLVRLTIRPIIEHGPGPRASDQEAVTGTTFLKFRLHLKSQTAGKPSEYQLLYVGNRKVSLKYS